MMKGTENDALAEKSYNSFIVNKGLSYFSDTIMYSNAMNCNHALDKKLQYEFLINTVRQRKRYSKWIKKDIDCDVDVVMEYYGYNRKNAKTALQLLSVEQLQIIKNMLDKGGKT